MLLRFDSLPELQADKMHWRIRARYRKAWHERVQDELWWQTSWKYYGSRPLEKAHLVCIRYSSGKAPDQDNLRYSFKPILDGLVRAGVLLDDSPEVITAEYHHAKAKRGAGYVTVEVTDAD